MKCRMFRNLPFTRMINKQFGHINNYCEIGIDKGKSAEITFKNVEFNKLYLCDIKVNPEIRKKYKKFEYVKIVELPSIEFFKCFPDNFFDVIWLDGNHNYKYLKDELPMAWSKTKYLLGGHDFFAQTYEVAKAVIEFKEHNKLKLNGICTNWWFQKN